MSVYIDYRRLLDGEDGGISAVVFPLRLATPKIAGDINGTALTSLALTASRQYFVPFSVPRAIAITSLRISVTANVAGNGAVGIYGNTVVSGSDAPGDQLVQATGLVMGVANEDKTGAAAITLLPGQIYWASLISSSAATVRALPVGAVQASLGRVVNNTTSVTHLFVSGSGSTLPATASTSLSNGTGNIPAIYLVGS